MEKAKEAKDAEIDELIQTVKSLKSEVDTAKNSLEATIEAQKEEI